MAVGLALSADTDATGSRMVLLYREVEVYWLQIVFTEQTKMKIVVFTGAGISRESGLQTYRDSDGLWAGHTVDHYGTSHAWRTNPQRVLDFFNARRAEVKDVQPNAAHLAIAALDAHHDVRVITQNVDDLHERAGSAHVYHLHGEITKRRSELDETLIDDWDYDIKIGDLAPDGGQYRPHLVFFDEPVPAYDMCYALSRQADILLVVGTSLQVYPAADIAAKTSATDCWVVDPKPIDPHVMRKYGRRVRYIREPATVGVPRAIKEMQDHFPLPPTSGIDTSIAY